MKREIIGIDIDDVLSSQVDILIEFSNNNYGTTLKHEDFKRPGEYWSYFENLWDVDKEEARRRYDEFLNNKYPLKQKVLKSTVEVINKLKKYYELHIVTSRGADYLDDTIEWLERHVPNVFKGVHFVDLWSNDNQKVTKAKICKDIGAGYLIDDNLEHCNLAAEVGVHALLFGEFGWNLDKKPHPLVVAVSNWQEVLDYFEEKQV
jgi:5'(3')-deoxyribonucleotidase